MEPKEAERSIKYIFKKYFKKSEAVYQLHGSVMFRWTFCSAPHHSCFHSAVDLDGAQLCRLFTFLVEMRKLA